VGKILKDLQVLDSELYLNVLSGPALPVPTGGAIALPIAIFMGRGEKGGERTGLGIAREVNGHYGME